MTQDPRRWHLGWIRQRRLLGVRRDWDRVDRGVDTVTKLDWPADLAEHEAEQSGDLLDGCPWDRLPLDRILIDTRERQIDHGLGWREWSAVPLGWVGIFLLGLGIVAVLGAVLR